MNGRVQATIQRECIRFLKARKMHVGTHLGDLMLLAKQSYEALPAKQRKDWSLKAIMDQGL